MISILEIAAALDKIELFSKAEFLFWMQFLSRWTRHVVVVVVIIVVVVVVIIVVVVVLVDVVFVIVVVVVIVVLDVVGVDAKSHFKDSKKIDSKKVQGVANKKKVSE